MIGVDYLMDILELHREGHSIHAIARLTGLSRNTVRKALRGQHDLKRRSAQRAGILDPFKDYLRQRRSDVPLSAVRLLEEIRGMGYAGSLPTLRRFLATLEQRATHQRRLTVRFETPPGQQAQADWAYAGKLADASGQPRSSQSERRRGRYGHCPGCNNLADLFGMSLAKSNSTVEYNQAFGGAGLWRQRWPWRGLLNLRGR
jgi:hypothetical protein